MISIDILGKIKGVFHKKDIDEEIEEVFGKERPTKSEMVLEGQKRAQEQAQVRETPPHRPDLTPTYDTREPAEGHAGTEQRAPLRTEAAQQTPRKEMALPDIPVLDDRTGRERAIPRESAEMNLESVLLEIRNIKAQNDVIIDTLRRIEERM